MGAWLSGMGRSGGGGAVGGRVPSHKLMEREEQTHPDLVPALLNGAVEVLTRPRQGLEAQATLKSTFQSNSQLWGEVRSLECTQHPVRRSRGDRQNNDPGHIRGPSISGSPPWGRAPQHSPDTQVRNVAVPLTPLASLPSQPLLPRPSCSLHLLTSSSPDVPAPCPTPLPFPPPPFTPLTGMIVTVLLPQQAPEGAS